MATDDADVQSGKPGRSSTARAVSAEEVLARNLARARPHPRLNTCFVGIGRTISTTLYRINGCRGMIFDKIPAFRSAAAERVFPVLLNQFGGEGRQVFRLTPTEQRHIRVEDGVNCNAMCSVCPQLADNTFMELTRWNRVRACWYVFDMENGSVNIGVIRAMIDRGRMPESDVINNIFVPFCMGTPRPSSASEPCGFDALGRPIEACPRIMWHDECRLMFHSSLSTDQQDRLMRQYCNTHPESAACDCLAAVSYPCRCNGEDEDQRCDVRCASRGIVVDRNSRSARVSSDLATYVAAPLSCWYAPCQEQTFYSFTPNTYLDQETDCPDVCGSFFNVEGEEANVNLGNVVIHADCSGTGRNTNEPVRAMAQAPVEDLENDRDAEDSFDFVMYKQWVERQTEWLIPAASIMAIAALLLTMIMVSSRRKREANHFYRGKLKKTRGLLFGKSRSRK